MEFHDATSEFIARVLIVFYVGKYYKRGSLVMDDATQTRVRATRLLKSLVPKVVALSKLMEQHKLEVHEEVFVHAVIILHRVLQTMVEQYDIMALVTVCCVLGCKLAIDHDALAPHYKSVARGILGQPCQVARKLARQEMEVLKALDFSLLGHIIGKHE